MASRLEIVGLGNLERVDKRRHLPAFNDIKFRTYDGRGSVPVGTLIGLGLGMHFSCLSSSCPPPSQALLKPPTSIAPAVLSVHLFE